MTDADDTSSLATRVLALPLFAELCDESRGTLEFECRLAFEGPGLEDAFPEGAYNRPSYLRLTRFSAGEAIHHQGDLCSDFCVVLSGTVQGSRAHPREGHQLLDTFTTGDWFGEVSALSLTPSLTTNQAVEDCELLLLDHRLFRKIYALEEDESFQEMVDERYRQRSLAQHLRSSPLLSNADPGLLKHLVHSCSFESFADGEEVAAAGDPVDAFYLVRSGGIRCTRAEADGRRAVLSYWMVNSSFGEQAVCTSDAKWPGDCVAMSRTDVVKIPVESFRLLRESNPGALDHPTHVANLVVSDNDAEIARNSSSALALQEVDVMVDGQSFKGGDALVIDQHKCVRCNMCVESCASVHKDGVPRISKIGSKLVTDDVLITACYNCDIPSCMLKCDFGAIRRDEDGAVRFVLENCVGCSECVKACPYDVIKMTEPEHHQAVAAAKPPTLVGSLLGLLLGRAPSHAGAAGCSEEASLTKVVINFGAEDEREEEVGGKAVKCDKCAGLPFEACVYNCPTSAIRRRTPEELFVKG